MDTKPKECLRTCFIRRRARVSVAWLRGAWDSRREVCFGSEMLVASKALSSGEESMVAAVIAGIPKRRGMKIRMMDQTDKN